MIHHEILVQHIVDIHKATSEFREASVTRKEQALCYPINCAEETQQRQLEPWTPTGKRRCIRTHCRKVAYHFFARGV